MTTIKTVNATYGQAANDAEFRLRVTEYAALLAACGLVQTADTGQIDVATVIKPAAGVIAGFQVWRFNDQLQATHPIFIKVEYGTSTSSSQWMAVYFAVGIQTDGAGNFIGAYARTGGAAAGSAALNTSSYACHVEGFFGIANRVGAAGSSYVNWGTFLVCRSCDANGYPTGDAVYLMLGYTDAYAQVLRMTGTPTAMPSSASTQVFQLPLGVKQSINGEVPMYPVWMPTPQLVPVFGTFAYPNSLVTAEDQARIAMVGTIERNYLLIPGMFTALGKECGFAMLWE